MKKQKGITLIALIITIIVMLILVGVTVNISMNGGLFERARAARDATIREASKEEIQVINAKFYADSILNPDNYSANGFYSKLDLIFADEIEEQENYDASVEQFEKINKYYYESELFDGIKENYDYNANIGKFDRNNLNFSQEYFEAFCEWIYINDDRTPHFYLVALYQYELRQVDPWAVVEYGGYGYGESGLIITLNYEYKGINGKTYIHFEGENGEIIKVTSEIIAITVRNTTTPVTVAENSEKYILREGVPIPIGFTYVSGTKDTGLVISGGSEEYVWVPVEENPTLQIDIVESKTINTVKIMNLEGTVGEYTVNDKEFHKTINVINNSIYEIYIEYEDDTVKEEIVYFDDCYGEYAKVEYIKVYNLLLKTLAHYGGGPSNLDEYCNYIRTSNDTDPVEFREIVGTINSNMDVIRVFANGNTEPIIDTTPEAASVAQYGGFYIARKERPEIHINFADARAACTSMYTENNNVSCDLPSAAAWYATVNWLRKTKAIDENEESSESWGNFEDNSRHGDVIPSGTDSTYKRNNIYDLAGNKEEWSLAVNDEGKRFTYGSHYGVGGFPTVLSSSEYLDTYIDDQLGYRPILYITTD